MRIAIVVLLLLAAAGSIGLGFAAAPSSSQPARLVPKVTMRALPNAAPVMVAVAAPPVAKGEDDLAELKPGKPGAKPAAAVKPAEVKPAPVVAAPAAVKPAEPRPVEAKPAEAKPADATPGVAPAAVAETKPADPKAQPAPVAAKPVPAAPAAKPPPPAAGAPTPATGGIAAAPTDGSLNLRASDTADVYIDGKKVGGSPVLGHKVKAGKHKIRFDCYEPSGDARPGVVQTVEVAADGEKDVEYECPAP